MRLLNPPFALSLLVLAACGEDAPRGPLPRPPLHLVVSGTDREMGLAHGRALAKEIQEEVGPRLAARLRAVATDSADAKFLEDACRLYTTRVKPLLSQPLRDELAGIAEGSGVPEDSILLLEVMREGLRFHLDHPPLVEAALASPPNLGDPLLGHTEPWPGSVVAAWDGAGGVDLTGHALLLERRPHDRARPTLVVTWPGGLGGLAGVSSNGILAAEAELQQERREQQTLNGVPFAIGLRVALESAESVDAFVQALPKLSANRALVVQDGVGRRLALISVADVPVQAPALAEWVLAAAGAGGDDPRVHAMEERLGSYSHRPGATATVGLAVSGRTAQVGAVIELFPTGIIWRTGLGADGGYGPVSEDLAFHFPSGK